MPRKLRSWSFSKTKNQELWNSPIDTSFKHSLFSWKGWMKKRSSDNWAEENPINNHAVKSLASWALGLIADLSWRYGPFDEIVVESARDALPEKIRKEIDKAMREQEKALDKIVKKYKDQFPTIDKRLARKIQLWATGFQLMMPIVDESICSKRRA